MKRIKVKNAIKISMLTVLSGLLLGLSALPSKMFFIVFVAIVPLLYVAELLQNAKYKLVKYFLTLFVAFGIFILWRGYWVFEAGSMIYLIGILIPLPIAILVSPYILVANKQSNWISLVFLIVAWVFGEFLQNHLLLSTPFFMLGNFLGSKPVLIQWFEYTGAMGGTIWILIVNIAIYRTLKSITEDRALLIKQIIFTSLIIVVPVIVSILIYNSYNEKGKSIEVVSIHPNTDCYDVKYQKTVDELMDIYLAIMKPALTENTEFVVLPETAITNSGWVSGLNNNPVFDYFHSQTAEYPNLKLITGAVNYEIINNIKSIKNYEKLPYIKYSKNSNSWYYTYNSALQVVNHIPTQIRTKEMLVPFQEMTPYPGLLPKISPIGINFQFSTRKEGDNVFVTPNGIKTSALICFEAAYGSLFSKLTKQGAQAFFLLLNEGWYLDIEVAKQFLYLSVIRAIEARRDIVRSSNMGVSGFINQRGDVTMQFEKAESKALKNNIRLNNIKTFYTRTDGFIEFSAIIIYIFVIIRFLFLQLNTRKL